MVTRITQTIILDIHVILNAEIQNKHLMLCVQYPSHPHPFANSAEQPLFAFRGE